MRICVFGGAGQVGTELSKRSGDNQVVPFDLDQVDITELEPLLAIVQEQKPQILINVAAYTAVDKAETETEKAMAVNALGARNVAIAAREVGARHISVSTDYVFGGESQREHGTPFREQDLTDPVNAYGATKLEGEKAVLEEAADCSLIVRTSSVHGAGGHNFVHTMLRLIEERGELNVVEDQIMSPTWAGWLAETLLTLSVSERVGILHASCAGAISWYEFAVAIRSLATFPDGTTPAKINPIPTEQYPTPAKRPAYSVLDCSQLEQVLSKSRIDWIAGLKGHLSDLGRLSDSSDITINVEGAVYE